ncbi:MAG TPA: hypothetical protein VJC12_03360 [Candidatus Paceibacterota bacterium]
MKLDFKKFKLPKKFFKKRDYKTLSDKARHDWRGLLIIFLIIYILVILANIYIFWQVNGSTYEASYAETQNYISVDEKQLKETVDKFESRKIKLDQIKKTGVNIPDPSL